MEDVFEHRESLFKKHVLVSVSVYCNWHYSEFQYYSVGVLTHYHTNLFCIFITPGFQYVKE